MIILSARYANSEHTSAVAITQDEGAVLLSEVDTPEKWLLLSNVEVVAFDENPLQTVKDLKWEEIKNARTLEIETKHFSYNGNEFQGGAETRTNLTGKVVACMVAGIPQDQVVEMWTLASNEVVPITVADLAGMGMAAAGVVSAAHERSRVLREQIDLADTVEQVQKITWEVVEEDGTQEKEITWT